MIIHFNPDSDALPWPGPRTGPSAYAGETWVGPLGLLGLLETALGLGGITESDTARAFALVPDLRDNVGFWNRSAEADPFATACRLAMTLINNVIASEAKQSHRTRTRRQMNTDHRA